MPLVLPLQGFSPLMLSAAAASVALEKLQDHVQGCASALLTNVPSDVGFAVVYLHAGVRWEDNSPGLLQLRTLYESLPQSLRSRVEAVYVVHPSIGFCFSAALVGPWLSDRWVQNWACAQGCAIALFAVSG